MLNYIFKVPYTCCHLSNAKDANGYLDPKPVNASICESLDSEVNIFGRYQQVSLSKKKTVLLILYLTFLVTLLLF